MNADRRCRVTRERRAGVLAVRWRALVLAIVIPTVCCAAAFAQTAAPTPTSAVMTAPPQNAAAAAAGTVQIAAAEIAAHQARESAIVAAVAAIIAAILAAAGTTYNAARGRRNDRDIAALKSASDRDLAALREIADQRLAEFKSKGDQLLSSYNADRQEQLSARNARLEYEFEARKRLYQACEPLLFTLNRSCQLGIGRVISLARSARDGELTGPKRILADIDAAHAGARYYYRSTIYQLFAPLAVVYLLQTRVALLDLQLDRFFARQVDLSAHLYRAYTRDFDFAEKAPALLYTPTDETGEGDDPQRRRQGLYLGELDTMMELFVEKDAGQRRVKTYGEFDLALAAEAGSNKRSYQPLIALFRDFHPDAAPVLWRILLAQWYVMRALRLSVRELFEAGLPDNTRERLAFDPRAAMNVAWRREFLSQPDAPDFVNALRVAHGDLEAAVTP